MASNEDVVDAVASVDIRAHRCPLTFVRVRLALDRLPSGALLAVRLVGDEPRRNVPLSATELGHAVLNWTDHDDGSATVLLRKG